MTFEQFQASRKWCDNLAAALDSAEWSDCTSGQLYADGLHIESALQIECATGEYVLTIGNVQTFGDLESLERMLYDWAMSEGYFD